MPDGSVGFVVHDLALSRDGSVGSGIGGYCRIESIAAVV